MVNRYYPFQYGGILHQDGTFVKYSDWKKLKLELLELKRQHHLDEYANEGSFGKAIKKLSEEV